MKEWAAIFAQARCADLAPLGALAEHWDGAFGPARVDCSESLVAPDTLRIGLRVAFELR